MAGTSTQPLVDGAAEGFSRATGGPLSHFATRVTRHVRHPQPALSACTGRSAKEWQLWRVIAPAGALREQRVLLDGGLGFWYRLPLAKFYVSKTSITVKSWISKPHVVSQSARIYLHGCGRLRSLHGLQSNELQQNDRHGEWHHLCQWVQKWYSWTQATTFWSTHSLWVLMNNVSGGKNTCKRNACAHGDCNGVQTKISFETWQCNSCGMQDNILLRTPLFLRLWQLLS